MGLKRRAGGGNVPQPYGLDAAQSPSVACVGSSERRLGRNELRGRRRIQRGRKPYRREGTAVGGRDLDQFQTSDPERAPRKGGADPLVDRTWLPILHCVGSDPARPRQTIQEEGAGRDRLLSSEVGPSGEWLGGGAPRQEPGHGFSGRGRCGVEDAEPLLAR